MISRRTQVHVNCRTDAMGARFGGGNSQCGNEMNRYTPRTDRAGSTHAPQIFAAGSGTPEAHAPDRECMRCIRTLSNHHFGVVNGRSILNHAKCRARSGERRGVERDQGHSA